MPGTQALKGARGKSTFTYWPEELTIITDPSDVLFDERVEDPVPDAAVLNIAAMGVLEPVLVYKRDGIEIVDDGIQRTKRALIANALVGRAYKGKIKAVLEAIERLRGSDVGKEIVALLPEGPLQIPALPVRERVGVGAYDIKAAANAHRHDDSRERLIQKAQRMAEQLNYPEERIAAAMNLTVGQVKRMLKVDLAAPKVTKVRSTVRRPGAKRIAAVRAALLAREAPMVPATDGALTALGWALGAVQAKDFLAAFPEAAEALR